MPEKEFLTQDLLLETLNRYGFTEPLLGTGAVEQLANWESYRVDLNDSYANKGSDHAWGRVEDWFSQMDSGLVAGPPIHGEDALPMYLPYHFCGPDWGIYIREIDILHRAQAIKGYLEFFREYGEEWAQLCRAALATLYLVAAFRHKVESFATRLEIARKAVVYGPYWEAVYKLSDGTDDNLENALAVADMVSRIRDGFLKTLPARVRGATLAYLQEAIPGFPPGYRRGLEFGRRPRTEELAAQVSEATSKPSQPAGDWTVATQMFRGLFNRDRVAHVLIPKGELPVIPWLDRPLEGSPVLDLFSSTPPQ